jgi:hypothetical protein
VARWRIVAPGRVAWVRDRQPGWLLTQNSELREEGIYNWTLPAWVVTLPNGRRFNVCPHAGACAKLCYARNGTYLFPAVREAHTRNLLMLLDGRLPRWERRMTAELAQPRYHGRHVRIHDSGDFFNEEYLTAWLRVMAASPHVAFYAYTKEVAMFRRVVEPAPPSNFRWVYSLGGSQDHMVDRDRDRHADVFPDEAAIAAAGYESQDASDLLAVYSASHRVGIPANNIAGFRRAQGARTFGELQDGRHRKPAAPVASRS